MRFLENVNNKLNFIIMSTLNETLYNVEEMSKFQMSETDGGFLTLPLIVIVTSEIVDKIAKDEKLLEELKKLTVII